MSWGYRKYLQNIIPRMAFNPAVENILCASPKALNVQIWFDQLPNVEFISCRPYHFLRCGLDINLKRNLEDFSPDVIFVPTERYFRFRKIPVVRMLQNMGPFAGGIEGNPLREKVKLWLQAIDAKKAIKKSDRVIAISKFVCRFLNQKWNIPKNKIRLVYYGIDTPEKNNKRHRPSFIAKRQIDQFLFAAGLIRPYRGLEDALLALKHLSSKLSNVPSLVIAGLTTPDMMTYKRRLEEWVQNHNLLSKVCWVDHLNEKEMVWCYRNCCAFLMTSRVESFGMIAGEAMSHGCICISADNPCLPELFDDAATFYPPKNWKALAETIKDVLAWNDNQRKIMSEKAKRRSSEFSWDVCAEKTVAELVKAVEDRKSRKM